MFLGVGGGGGSVTTAPQPRRGRDHRGNYIGGEQNASMQKYQMCESLEQKEHKRWLAHRDAGLAATFPTSLEINGVTIPIFKFEVLDQLGAKRVRERALNLRDSVEATRSRFFEHHPQHRLNVHGQPEQVTAWIIDVQVALAKAVGYDDLDHAAFGAPEPSAQPSAAAPPPQQQGFRKQPCWSQSAVLDREASPPARTASPPRQSFPWSQHGVVGADEPWRQTPSASHDGFSLVPPHMNDASWNAAHFRNRAQTSTVVLG